MTISSHDAWVLTRVMKYLPVDGELAAMEEPWREMAESLLKAPQGHRREALLSLLLGRPYFEDVFMAMDKANPLGPAPAGVPAIVTFATMADVAKVVASQAWL